MEGDRLALPVSPVSFSCRRVVQGLVGDGFAPRTVHLVDHLWHTRVHSRDRSGTVTAVNASSRCSVKRCSASLPRRVRAVIGCSDGARVQHAVSFGFRGVAAGVDEVATGSGLAGDVECSGAPGCRSVEAKLRGPVLGNDPNGHGQLSPSFAVGRDSGSHGLRILQVGVFSLGFKSPSSKAAQKSRC